MDSRKLEKIPTKIKEIIVQDYTNNKGSLLFFAKKYSILLITLKRLLEEYNITIRGKVRSVYTEDENDTIAQDFLDNNPSIPELVNKYKIDMGAIKRVLKERGIIVPRLKNLSVIKDNRKVLEHEIIEKYLKGEKESIKSLSNT